MDAFYGHHRTHPDGCWLKVPISRIDRVDHVSRSIRQAPRSIERNAHRPKHVFPSEVPRTRNDRKGLSMTLRDHTLSRSDLRTHLRLLETERRQALVSALADDPQYMEDLADEIAAARTAYVTVSVLELARNRSRCARIAQG
jgi:hypothetical protein